MAQPREHESVNMTVEIDQWILGITLWIYIFCFWNVLVPVALCILGCRLRSTVFWRAMSIYDYYHESPWLFSLEADAHGCGMLWVEMKRSWARQDSSFSTPRHSLPVTKTSTSPRDQVAGNILRDKDPVAVGGIKRNLSHPGKEHTWKRTHMQCLCFKKNTIYKIVFIIYLLIYLFKSYVFIYISAYSIIYPFVYLFNYLLIYLYVSVYIYM